MLYEKFTAAFETRDVDQALELYHPDYTFIRHAANVTISLAEWTPIMRAMMESDDWVLHDNRCLYENDEVLVMHNVLSFPDGTKEAVLAFHRIKDGRIYSTETGATPL